MEQWFEKATAYFSGGMTPEEAKLFEAETAANEEWSRLMQSWKTIDAEAAIYEQSEEEASALILTHQKLRGDFVDEHPAREFSLVKKETGKHSRKIKFSVWQWVAVAGVLSGIILSTELLITSPGKEKSVVQTIPKQGDNNKVSDNRNNTSINKDSETAVKPPDKPQAAVLYAQAFAPDKVPENFHGTLDDAFFYYARAEYENAVAAIDKSGTNAATRGNNGFTPLTEFYASYYKALSLMSLTKTKEAIPLLQQALQQSPADVLSAKTQWYLALAYLKEEKIPDAAKTLKTLTNNPGAGNHKDKAEKLLIQIEE